MIAPLSRKSALVMLLLLAVLVAGLLGTAGAALWWQTSAPTQALS